jgi:trans-aconitate 2-methyltransferase
MSWNPDQYNKFQAERAAPFDDLLALVEVRPGLRVVDLGCGTGELTRRLAEHLPGSDVLGLDNSSSMLEKAAALTRPGLRFELADQAEIEGAWDLIFSNAALHWSEDHPHLVRHLFGCLGKGGQLAVQVPSSHMHVSQRLIRETAREEPYRSLLQGFVRESPVLSIAGYAQLLFDLGAAEILVFEKVYPHVLADADAVVEWVSGTALVPYFERLGPRRDDFVEAYRRKLRAAMPASPLFYPFTRTLFSARRSRDA